MKNILAVILLALSLGTTMLYAYDDDTSSVKGTGATLEEAVANAKAACLQTYSNGTDALCTPAAHQCWFTSETKLWTCELH
jgi:hypothetical protein